MSETPSVQKATIYKLDQSGALVSSKSVVCHFNPKEFEIKGRINGLAEQPETFGKTLLEIASVDPQQENTQTGMGVPARCQFQWGRLLSFNAVIKDITQRFIMFKPDGTPLRARVSVTFSQVGEQPQRQNPTSRSEPRRVRVVREGERLDWIAYQEYGNAAHWRHIARANDLADLRPGQALQLPPLTSQ